MHGKPVSVDKQNNIYCAKDYDRYEWSKCNIFLRKKDKKDMEKGEAPTKAKNYRFVNY